MSGPVLRCRSLSVAYGPVTALRDVDLDVATGELVCVLGPSGSGKTTLLHAVAGFIPVSGGSIELAGRVVSDETRIVPPEDRTVGVVFQAHALWPHLTVAETVAFPLDGARSGRVVDSLLEQLGIAHLAGRRPHELSGGEQQRVSLARAIARRPVLFLLDEPTAHLDVPLRSALLEDLDRQRLADNTPAVYATHDAAEALAIADRIALLDGGAVVQVGTPEQVYERPVDMRAARLTGAASVVPAAAVAGDPGPTVTGAGEDAVLRPEWVVAGGPLEGTIERIFYRGTRTEYRLDTPAGAVLMAEVGPARRRVGDALRWGVRRAHLVSRR
ncbi:MAG: ABC transporter ATP-binding protein [Acidimicrobiia bacterium]|nr:ABC transporter ATP-binding protein [Acidimicrobiia bacterium]NNF09904.1 ABC transporter ATP-binding protein [Acidimicrobiia bacterium]NNL70531.1 ABC transporter ATP-binding protein [Acidimicrobiia bacterium]